MRLSFQVVIFFHSFTYEEMNGLLIFSSPPGYDTKIFSSLLLGVCNDGPAGAEFHAPILCLLVRFLFPCM